MCTDISSRISSLQVETDKARLLNVGIKPASTLQQAPWWIKIPKRLTWLNLPDGVNDNQRDKDLARMGILNRPPSPASYGIRTPSPDYVPCKRRRRRMREWQDDYAIHGDWDDSYAHLAEPPPSWEMDLRDEVVDVSNGDAGSSMMSLLQVVEDDMRMQLGPPPQLTWPKNREPFVPMTYPPRPDMEYRAPLLPRPPMMPPDTMAGPNGFVQRPFIPPLRPAPPPMLPPLRLDSNDGHAKLTVPPMEINPSASSTHQIDIHPESSLTQTTAPLRRKPSIDPPLPSTPIPEYPQHITPKPIAPRPGTTPIHPSHKPSRPSSSSPDLLRKQRLLPKSLPPPQPHTPPPPREEDRPPHERFPLQRLNERANSDSPSIIPATCAAVPSPAPHMGRFGSSGGRQEGPGQAHGGNSKGAVPRQHEGTGGPLRIAPAPAKKVDAWSEGDKRAEGSATKDESVKSGDVKGDGTSEKGLVEKVEGTKKSGTEGEAESITEVGRPGLRSRKRHV